MAFIWLVNGGDPPHLLNGILQNTIYSICLGFERFHLFIAMVSPRKNPANPRIRRDVVVAMSLDQPLASHPSWCAEAVSPWEPWETLEKSIQLSLPLWGRCPFHSVFCLSVFVWGKSHVITLFLLPFVGMK